MLLFLFQPFLLLSVLLAKKISFWILGWTRALFSLLSLSRVWFRSEIDERKQMLPSRMRGFVSYENVWFSFYLFLFHLWFGTEMMRKKKKCQISSVGSLHRGHQGIQRKFNSDPENTTRNVYNDKPFESFLFFDELSFAWKLLQFLFVTFLIRANLNFKSVHFNLDTLRYDGNNESAFAFFDDIYEQYRF